MAQSYFIWNGIDCRSMGVWLQGPVAIVRPEERVRHVEIPGRSGDLTETEGEYIYNSYIQTATILVKGGYRVRDVYAWLRGAGYVTFSGEPDRRQKARIIGAVTLNKHAYNLDWWVGEIQFYCQPLKEKLQEETVTITSSGSTIRNNGDVECYPLIKAVPSLSLLGIAVGDKPGLIITGQTSGSAIWIDSATMEIWNADRSATITEKSSGNFPVLQPGSNIITFAGISSIEIEKRERFL
jgi:phage-related protein